jgi:hypothetical protein
MSHRTKREYLAAIWRRYRRVGRRFKRKILDEFCAICGYVRIPAAFGQDSDFIRTGFRRMSDSVPEFAGQCSGDIRTAIRDGSDSVPDQSGHCSGVSGQFFRRPEWGGGKGS